MSQIYYNKLKLNNDNAVLFELSNQQVASESLLEKSRNIFNKLDSDKNGILNTTELSIFINNLRNYVDSSTGSASSKGLKSFVQNFFPEITVDELKNFLVDIQKNYLQRISSISDGVINWTSQGFNGDCWLLSQARSLSQTSWGKEAIKNSIMIDKNGNYIVEFKGVNYKVTISSKEVQKAKKSPYYSNGDIDMLLLELATKKYFKKVLNGKPGDIISTLSGNLPVGEESLQFLLTGNKGYSIYNLDSESVNNDYELKYYQDSLNTSFSNRNQIIRALSYLDTSNYQLTCDIKPRREWEDKSSGAVDKFSTTAGHAYSVKEIRKDSLGNPTFVVLTNPWDAGVDIVKSIDDFINEFDSISITANGDEYSDFMNFVNKKSLL